MTTLPLWLGASLAGGVWLAAVLTARLVSWWTVRQHRLDGIDPRVLRPVAQRLTRGK